MPTAEGSGGGVEETADRLLAGRYALGEVVGRGGMGWVWRGWDRALNRPVAVKVLAPASSDPTADERFAREARIIAGLTDPHVVAVYDHGTAGGRPYLVMELLHGRTLRQELRTDGPLTPRRAALLAGQAATGLAAAHRAGIVHRDVKPANLIADGDALTVLDFGIAARLEETAQLTATGQVLGTVDYLAPERAVGHAATPAADVYALGCVLHELLSGRPPFQADTPAALLYQHVHETPGTPHPPFPAPPVPTALAEYALRLLAKDPAERPTAAEAAAWLAAWAADAPLPLPPLRTPAGLSAPSSPATAATGAPAQAVRPSGRARRPRGRTLAAVLTAAGLVAAAPVLLLGPLDQTSGAAAPVHHAPAASASGSPAPIREHAARTAPSGGGSAARVSLTVSSPRAIAAQVADSARQNGGRSAGTARGHGRSAAAPGHLKAEKPGGRAAPPTGAGPGGPADGPHPGARPPALPGPPGGK